MNNFKLEPVDILVTVNQRQDPISTVKRWLIGPYDHVLMYMGRLGLSRSGYSSSYLTNVPFLFESNGRGVVLQSLSNRYGQEVVVMRLKSEHDKKRIPHVLDEAIELASKPQSYYDYLCIIKFVLPRIIFEKLRLPMPLSWHRDERQICSEACFEVFYRAKLVDILRPYCTPPLPGDFVTDSPLLEEAQRGILSDEWV